MGNAHNTGWSDEVPPNLETGPTTGRLRGCDYCGSMHPADLAAAIRAGATGEFADWKYGWPHKMYFDGIPNPFAGMPESRVGTSNPPQAEIDAGKWISIPSGMFDQRTGEPHRMWYEAGRPAADRTYGKFYSIHLKDASPEDRDVIEKHIGLNFTFSENRVYWSPYAAAEPAELESKGEPEA